MYLLYHITNKLLLLYSTLHVALGLARSSVVNQRVIYCLFILPTQLCRTQITLHFWSNSSCSLGVVHENLSSAIQDTSFLSYFIIFTDKQQKAYSRKCFGYF